MEKNFEETLPENYKEVYHINAKDFKVGLIFNLVALVPFILITAIAVAVALITDLQFADPIISTIELWIGILVMVVYIIAHELIHGISYKSLTKRKLTFGLSWSCAFCGVPDIYCYRRTALIALIMPFAVFNVVFIALTVGTYFVDFTAFVLSALLFGMHIGGCSGDLYMFGLLVFKYKDKTLLMRDTGPEQFLYVKE